MIWIPKAKVEDALKLRDSVVVGQKIRANATTGECVSGNLIYRDRTMTVTAKYRYGFMSKEYGFATWNSAAICDQRDAK